MASDGGAVGSSEGPSALPFETATAPLFVEKRATPLQRTLSA
jgi:hypothetical protein